MKPVFLLDVDGVLKKGDKALKSGQDALDYLMQNNIDYILLSNTTGDDDVVCKHLATIIERPITVNNLITASTPLNIMFGQIPKDTPMLIIGAQRFSKVIVEKYGFTKAFFPNELQQQVARRCPQYIFCQTQPSPSSKPNIYNNELIQYIIFHADSTDWYADIQICLDCLINYGQLAINLENRNNTNHQIKVLCTNPDVIYADMHVIPRLTVGAAAEALKCLYSHMTGKSLDIQYLGKPFAPIFQIAFQRFGHLNQSQLKYYMVGDSLSSDIRGGNMNNCESVLVLTGKNTKEEALQATEEEKPKLIYEDVFQAVVKICNLHASK